ncbi:MAG: Bug family tripartite tricarboxylate transporter substrate binding protein [Pseudorhodoplanes sp.]|uniref:Bug family tripartite tricarboxylate transporter substrate binding protein n=1 Tax=Pseudorhodoplanes sp. TaxID=1934341 RepID=UPI003D0C00F4
MTRLSQLTFSLLLGLIAMMGPSEQAKAQAFPEKPVRIIVQTAAGSSIDVAARILADNLTRRWNQQVIILNQPGAGGAIATRALASAPNDGYTLFFAASSVFVVLPELQKALAADVNSFVPIAFVGETPMAIAVSSKTPAKSLAELVALAKQTTGGLNVAVSTRGGLSHLSAEALRERAKMEMTFVHYPGTAQALTDVIADRVPVIVDSISAIVGPASGGQVRLLAVAGPSRLKSLPDIATASEALPGFEAMAWFALVAPKGTNADIVRQIGKDVDAVLQEPAVAKRLQELGAFPRPMSPEALQAFIEAQKKQWAPIVQRAGG